MAASKAKPLIALLRKREVTIGDLCKAVPMSKTAFSHVLNERREGRYTWPKLRSLLTDEEKAAVVAEYGEVFES